METNDTRNGPIDTGHCLNELPVSGAFLMLAQNGTLMTVCEMIQQRTKIAAEIQKVEQQLRSCNHPYAVPDFVEWCEERRKEFASEFIKRVEELENRRSELMVAQQRIDEQLAQLNLNFEWTLVADFVSLIPETRGCNPGVDHRNFVIDANRKQSQLDICKHLDSIFCDRERPPGFFPENWTEDFGVSTFVEAYRHPKCKNRVGAMISKRAGRHA